MLDSGALHIYECECFSVVVTKPAPPDSPVKKPDYSCEFCQTLSNIQKLWLIFCAFKLCVLIVVITDKITIYLT